MTDSRTTTTRIRTALTTALAEMPGWFRTMQEGHVERFVFHLQLVADRVPPGGTVCDVGGGWGVFSLGCASLGLGSILVDDFGDRGFLEAERLAEVQAVLRHHGVEIQSRDVVAEGIDFAPGTLDAVTCFDAIEHFHHSPKRFLHTAMAALRPGGRMVISTPNCANLRKRVAAVTGQLRWTSMEEWYEQERFRSHVREPSVGDLRYIAGDLGLGNVSILGRNWSGMESGSALVRMLTVLGGRMLTARPALCANIYLVGEKQQHGATGAAVSSREQRSAIR